jgi:F0F1-type ATP synthase membrane subunit b/b'
MASTEIRFAAFNKTKDEYSKTVETAQVEVRKAVEDSKSKIRLLQTTYQGEYEQACATIAAEANERTKVLAEAFNAQLLAFAQDFPKYLDMLDQQLQFDRNQILRSVPQRALGFLFPQETDLFRLAVKRWFREAREKVAVERNHYLELKPTSGCNRLLQEIQRFLSKYKFELDGLYADIQSLSTLFDDSIKRAEKIKEDAAKRAEVTRAGLIQRFSEEVSTIHAAVVDTMVGWQRAIAGCLEKVSEEAKPLGINLDMNKAIARIAVPADESDQQAQDSAPENVFYYDPATKELARSLAVA